jgi:hypothetical protein
MRGEPTGIGEASPRTADRHETDVRIVEPAIAVAAREEQKGCGAADCPESCDRYLQHMHRFTSLASAPPHQDHLFL